GAKDMASGKKQHITITASSGLSKEEIDKLVKDAQSHESEDKKRREEIEIKNSADALVYSTEKTVKENREKLPVKMVNDVEAALEVCKKALKESDVDQIKKTSEELMQVSHKMAEELYKNAPKDDGKGPEAGAAPGEEKKKEEGAIDAEFEEAKE
ncbi:MAG: Hsp70 family protein, partial [Deltaproteobacteria bacterium]|nr:Hsp70 family protein [Deltaproteobacteria bacterium]